MRYSLFSLARNALSGIDCELLTPRDVMRWVPLLNLDAGSRYPVLGGVVQKRGDNAHHDAVAWGYARARRATSAQPEFQS